MYPLDPGPLRRFELSELAPFPPRASFETLVVDALADLAAIDAQLAAASAWTLENPPDEIDGVFASTVGAANAAVDDLVRFLDDSPWSAIIDNGNNEDGLRTTVLSYLPPSTAPIETNYDEPPT